MLMRLPRPRFTVRRLMIAVAIVAIFLGVWLWAERRRARLDALASWHDRQVVCVFKGYIGPDDEIIWEPTSRPLKMGDPPVSLRQQRISTWHRQFAQKYWRAARYPWLPVEPDPPEPK
jgi:hypothetical protein